jgi:hypothetical protein
MIESTVFSFVGIEKQPVAGIGEEKHHTSCDCRECRYERSTVLFNRWLAEGRPNYSLRVRDGSTLVDYAGRRYAANAPFYAADGGRI